MSARRFFTVTSVLLPLCTALTFGAVQPQIHLSHPDGVKGLAGTAVRTIFEDSRGYVWIGTEAGLKRYDGSAVTSFGCGETGLESDFVLALGEDLDSNVWVGTSKGVAVYDYRMDSFFIPKDAAGESPSVNISYRFALTPSGDICFGTIDGDLWTYGRQDRLLHRHGLNLGRYLKSMITAGDGSMFLLTYYGYIYRYDIASERISPLDIGDCTGWFDGDDVADIDVSPMSDDILYVAAKSKGLCLVDLQTKEVRRLAAFRENVRPTDMAVSGGRCLYVSTTANLVRYDILSGSHIVLESGKDAYSLPGGGVSSVAPGRSGRLWIGTTRSGVCLLDPQNERFHKHCRTAGGESLEACVVSSLAEDEAGDIWLATKQKGLLRHRKAEGVLEHPRIPGLPDDLLSICADGPHIWTGTNDGIFRYTPSTGDLRHYSLMDRLQARDNRVETVFRTPEGNILAGCVYGGVIAYDRERDCFEYMFDSRETAIKTISEDRAGTIWMTSFSKGLFSADTKNPAGFRNWALSSAPGVGDMVYSAFVDRSDRVWVFGYNGRIWTLNREAGRLELYADNDSGAFPDASFFSATEDSDGLLWIASSAGLINCNPGSGGCRLFTEDDGLLNGRPTGAILCASDGTIYSGFADGIVSFRPSDIVAAAEPPRVDLLSMTVNGKPVSPASDELAIPASVNFLGSITLSPDQDAFGFKVAVPDSPSAIILYRLAGYEDRLRCLPPSRELSWYGVPPGTYTLEFYWPGLNNSQTRCRGGLTITVRQPFFKSLAGIILIISVTLLLLVLTTLVSLKKERRKSVRNMEEYERIRKEQEIKEKMSFFSGIIHEIKTPLTLISSPLKNIESMDCDLPDEVKNDLDVISRGSAYMNTLVRELLEYIKTGTKEYKIKRSSVDVVGELRTICAPYEAEAGKNALTLTFTSSVKELTVYVDLPSLYKIVNNILINALRYAETEIRVSLEVERSAVRICFSNDGEPIPRSRREEIFKPFVHYDKEDVSRGFGIGLTFARSLAELGGGSLTLSPSERTEFVLTLPVDRPEEPGLPSDDIQPEKNDGRPTILIVEDNTDIMDYEVSRLSADYNVLSCPSAESALSLLATTPVDLLLSDIKLGRMSGIELCRRVTSSFETSHIPVIMVSGIATESVKTQCLEAGAGMYIEKPFTIEYLTAAISRIFDTRSKIISHYLNKNSSSAGLSDLGSCDSDFLRRLEESVDRHISDTDFSVAALSEELFLSQSTLNRKLSSLLGMNAGEYIKDKRLRVALDLLRTPGIRVNEVCYRVGFSSQSYFTRAFREKYGKTPSEYIR